VADGNDTFNIETMLNDNWDKIDADKKSQDEAIDAHKAENMPHLIKDVTNNKIYRYGLRVKDGITQFICEEVV